MVFDFGKERPDAEWVTFIVSPNSTDASSSDANSVSSPEETHYWEPSFVREYTFAEMHIELSELVKLRRDGCMGCGEQDNFPFCDLCRQALLKLRALVLAGWLRELEEG